MSCQIVVSAPPGPAEQAANAYGQDEQDASSESEADVDGLAPEALHRTLSSLEHDRQQQESKHKDKVPKLEEEPLTDPIAKKPDAESLEFKTHSGVVFKKKRSGFKRWQQRWLYLHKDKLYYFDDKKPEPCACFNLYAAQVGTQDKQSCRFQLKYGSRDMKFKVGSCEEVEKWLSCILHNQSILLQQAERKEVDLHLAEAEQPGSWKLQALQRTSERTTIPSMEVADTCNTGDVILFQSRRMAGSMIRKATHSEFDHVGLLLKFKNGRFGVLETLGNTGVQISAWNGFTHGKWYLQYFKVVVRRLHGGEETIDKLTHFVQTTNGRKYKWTPGKSLAKSPSKSFDNEQRTFFCSELVAAAYKEMGLLRPDFRTGKYLPRSFAEKSQLVLLGDAYLGGELEVDFSDIRKVHEAQAAT